MGVTTNVGCTTPDMVTMVSAKRLTAERHHLIEPDPFNRPSELNEIMGRRSAVCASGVNQQLVQRIECACLQEDDVFPCQRILGVGSRCGQ